MDNKQVKKKSETKPITIPLATLFFIFFKIGAFTIGGGYAMLPIIRTELVERRDIITDESFLETLALAQSAPGAIAVNTAVIIGYRLRRLPGALIAVLGTVLPSFLIILLLATFFLQFRESLAVQKAFAGIRPAVAALIAAAVLKLGYRQLRKLKNLYLFLIFLSASLFLNVHPILIIIFGGICGLLFYREEIKKENDSA
ncbi:MAG: chromate transporter [Dethiobacteria bacterium]